MPCNIWFDLAKKHRLAVHSYGDAIDNLNGSSIRGFAEAWRRIDAARDLSEDTRAALLEHQSEHDCILPEPKVVGRVSADLHAGNLVLGDQGQSGG